MVFIERNSSGYYIGRNLVTNNLWNAVIGNQPPNFTTGIYPAKVKWDECQQFIQKLNIITGKKFPIAYRIRIRKL